MNRTLKIKKFNENFIKIVFYIAALFSIIAVAAIFVFLFIQGIPAISKIGLFNFLLGSKWDILHGIDYYTSSTLQGSYGIATTIIGTVYVTLFATLIGGVIGVFTAIFLSRFCPKKLKNILSQLVNLLAGIPSVIYGFFGLNVIQPLLGKFSDNGSGTGILSVSIILAIMILPTIIAISKNSLDAVPDSYYEASRALGDSHSQSVFGAILPAAKSGIVTSIILGVGRAIGETMAVALLCGNATVFPNGMFGAFSTMTSHIVNGLGELQPNQVAFGAMVATGFVLFIFVLIINLLFQFVNRKRDDNKKTYRTGFFKNKSKIFAVFLKCLSYITSILSIVSLGIIVLYIFIKGLPNITSSMFAITGTYSGSPTILPSIISTLMLVFLSLIIAVPIGIGASIFLSEYTKSSNKLIKVIRIGIETLASIPSIIYALFGAAFFVYALKFGVSILSGALTISLMIIPVIIRSCEESLKTVPDSYREGSYALGSGKIRTIFKIIIPSALSGILSSVILSIGRIVSESAPLLFTMGGGKMTIIPTSFMSSGTSLSVLMYAFSGENKYMNECWATASILLIIIFTLNLLSTLIVRKFNIKKR
ncbi:MAG: phosphate ABC transporter permease subunit PstC [Bacilli bacterium]|nr:phosphate ABC transporter permease subunit PstC [Bacilli bacterium]MDD4063555.1 phosphate ABC transporter permease subunit PstC [Bacilli bacterium]MDD4482484.1 phosphate ABC transporter permease subunit PstC [Bacilli bacterium]MDD5183005.1 phosphate ABC transporter permease subunit PstC [Bacilli bacterium]